MLITIISQTISIRIIIRFYCPPKSIRRFALWCTVVVISAYYRFKVSGVIIGIDLLCTWQRPTFRAYRFCCSIHISSDISIIFACNRSSTGDDIVANLVTYGPSGKECWGNSNGWGPAYENTCIHSGTIISSGDLPTNWYNYALASAGTIVDKNTTSSNLATNTDKATESVCPRGWTLPSKTQIDSQTDIASFFPVLGGSYGNGTLDNEATRGSWWGSEAYDGAVRYRLSYDGSSLSTRSGRRHVGYYVRCVQAP